MEAAAFLLPLPLHLPAFLFGLSTLALAAFCAAYFQVSSNDCKMRCGREGYNVVSGERRAELWRVEATHFELFRGVRECATCGGGATNFPRIVLTISCKLFLLHERVQSSGCHAPATAPALPSALLAVCAFFVAYFVAQATSKLKYAT